jgi:septal ring factor EnvC (AmiA/AmiB activator)
MNRKTRLLFSLTAIVTAPSLLAKPQIEDTRNVLGEWVETRQIISQERSEWQTEKAILTDTVDLLSNELERLEQQIADLEASATVADEERAELTAQRDALSAGSNAVLQNIGELEIQLREIAAQLPAPLVDKIKPLTRRLPDAPENTKLSLGERVQNVVGILSQAGKFNSTMTLTSETQELDNGKRIQVSTLYWGNAIAYFVDDSGAYAGYGTPGDDGWEWTQLDEAGAAIRELLAVYDGSSDSIKFVEVPARIQ